MTRPYIPMLAENNARRGFFEREQLDAMQRHLPEPIRPVAFRGAWQAACRAAGVPGRIFHDLRRTSVRNLERAGVPRSVAMKLTGHKTEAIYRRYAIVNDADLRPPP